MEEVHKTCSQARPWVRFWARMLDYTLLWLILYLIMGGLAMWWPVPLIVFGAVGLLTTLIWVPIEAWFITMWGATPGKALLRVSVRNSDGSLLKYGESIHRAFSVWVRGMGLGLPLVWIITCIVAYTKLHTRGITTWDKKLSTLTEHKVIGGGPVVLYILIMIAIHVAFVSTTTLAVFSSIMPPAAPF